MTNEEIAKKVKEFVEKANKERRNENPQPISVAIVDYLVSCGAIDKEGNLLKEPVETGKKR